jgi:hypothetical protein
MYDMITKHANETEAKHEATIRQKGHDADPSAGVIIMQGFGLLYKKNEFCARLFTTNVVAQLFDTPEWFARALAGALLSPVFRSPRDSQRANGKRSVTTASFFVC